MRDLMMLGAMLIMVPMALANGFVAYLFWGYTGLLTANYYVFGFMQPVRYNLIFALIAIAMLMVGRVKERGALTLNRTTFLLILFLFHGTLCTIFAYDLNPLNSDRLIYFSKAMLFALLMPYFVTSRVRIHAVLLIFAIGLGLHAVLDGLKVISSGGAHHSIGIPGSSLSDNNLFAVGIAMTLPIMLYLAQYSKFKVTRAGFIVAMSLTIIAVLGTQSRGGFLSLAAVGLWLMLSSRSKLRAVLFVLLGAAIVYYFAPDTWFDRMSTIQSIQSVEDDNSFIGRVAAWQISSAIALANPIFGGGFHAVQIQWIWDTFKLAPSLFHVVPLTEMPIIAKAAHSIYFQVLGDLGFPGFFMFLAILINALWTCMEIRKLATSMGVQFVWARDLADMIGVSLFAYMVGGGGVGLAYYEFPYALYALLEIVKHHLIRMRTDSSSNPTWKTVKAY